MFYSYLTSHDVYYVKSQKEEVVGRLAVSPCFTRLNWPHYQGLFLSMKLLPSNLYDLFGEIPVYTYDIELWLMCAPKMLPDSPRAAWYVKGWDVVSKIRRAKLAGTFQEMRASAWHDFSGRWL